MNRDPQTNLLPKPAERHQQSRAALIDRICGLIASGQSLHEVAGRAHMPKLATLRRWLAEDEAFRARYEKARAIGRTFVLDDVLALADSLPGTGRADIRLKLAARKWWAAEVWKTSKPETPAQMKARIEAEKKRKEEERIAQLEAYWAGEDRRRRELEEQRRREAEASETLKTGEILVYAPKPEPDAAKPIAAPEPAAPAAAKVPSPAPAPTPKPQLVRSIYDLSALPPPKSHTEVKTMKDWDALNWRSY